MKHAWQTLNSCSKVNVIPTFHVLVYATLPLGPPSLLPVHGVGTCSLGYIASQVTGCRDKSKAKNCQ